uniref:BRO1 domain-containing protein n=1 Tax=Rhabditophanes sp. KR3021 TaxID=114890 RepID=A0AC35UA02_9BILA
MVQFISVPLKSTTEVDFVKPLRNFVKTFYKLNDEQSNEVNEAIQELNKLRSKACCQPNERSQAALEVLLRYSDQLAAIENKLTINPTTNPVAFKWKDAFDKGSVFFSRASLTINDSSFERAAVLFNCAAMMSIVGAGQLMNTDEELKSAAKLFQQSAGIFHYLQERVLGMLPQDPTPDLMPDTLASLSALMLAQAQEAIYIKGKKDAMKQGSLVQIAAQCAEFYGEAKRLMSRDIVKGIWDKEWMATVTGKEMTMLGFAQYHQSQVAENEKNYGEVLSRLLESLSILKKSGEYIAPSSISGETDQIKAAYETSKKHNDMIYHEAVADIKALPPLKKAALVRATGYTPPLFTRFKDMFEALVPIEIQTAVSAFESRKAELVNIETSRLREYTDVMNAILVSLNLPAALDDVTNHEKCPESIRQKGMKIRNAGGLSALNRMMNDIPDLFKNNEQILNETEKLIGEEKEVDDNLRAQFKERWTRTKSDELTPPLLQQVGKYKGIMHTASNADQLVRNKFNEARSGIEILSKPEVDLVQSIPAIQGGAAQNSETTNKLRNLLTQVREICAERIKLEEKFKNVKCDMCDTFLKAKREAGAGAFDEQEVSNRQLAVAFSELKGEVEKSIGKQEQVLAEIEVTNRLFVQEKGSAGNAERDQLLKSLATAADTYFTLESNLKEGTKFYNDLVPLLVSLQQNVSDFCFARQTEKEDLMKQVQQSIISVAGGKAAVPPRPPPPSVPGSSIGSGVTPTVDATAPTPAPRAPPPQMPTLQQSQHMPLPQGYSSMPTPQYQQGYMPHQPYQPYNPYGNAYGNYPQQPQYYSLPYPANYPNSYQGGYQNNSGGGTGAPPPPPYHQQQPQQGGYPPQQPPPGSGTNTNPFT